MDIPLSTRSPLALSLLLCLLAAGTAIGATFQDAASADQETESKNGVQAPAEDLWSRPGADWNRMLGADGTSTSIEKGLKTSWKNKKPPLVWSRKAMSGYGNGVVSKGRWFYAEREDFTERLVCLQAETGKFLWKHEKFVNYFDRYGYSNGPRCSPLVHQDKVYSYGVTGVLACLDVSSGKLLWERELNKEYGVLQNFFGVGATPVIYGNLIIAMVGGSPEESQKLPDGQQHLAKPNGTGMVAFDCNTGKEVYRTGNYLASYSAPLISKIQGKDYCLSLMREGLMIFEPETGKEIDFFPWRATTTESVNAATPVVVDDEIIISETYEIGSTRLKLEDGKLVQVWKDHSSPKRQMMRAHWATPIAIGDFLFGCSGRNEPDADLRCVNWKTQKVQWNEKTRSRSTLLLVDGHFLTLFEDGKLAIIKVDPQRFEKVAEIDFETWLDEKDQKPLLETPTWAPPVFSHGYLYLRGPKRVICLDMISP